MFLRVLRNSLLTLSLCLRYCIDFTKGPPSAPYLQFSALDFGTIPVIVVLTKADEVKTTIRAELAAKGLDVTDENVEHEMESRIAAKRTEINGRESWSFLPVENCKLP